MSEHTIDIWRTEISSESKIVQNYYDLLSKDERDRSNKFRFQKDEYEYIVSRGFLRTVLSSYLNLSPENLKFSYGSFGKPFLSDESTRLKFNLSHSSELTLIAVNRNDEIGIDLEFVKDIDDRTELAKNLFTDNEIELLNNAHDSNEVFFQIWTRKEAIIKAVGKGLSLPLNLIDVSNPDSIFYNNSNILTKTEFDNCKLYKINSPDGFEASLASFGEKKNIVYKN